MQRVGVVANVALDPGHIMQMKDIVNTLKQLPVLNS